jgi:serine/threonine protein kinase
MESLIQKWSGDRISHLKIERQLQRNKYSSVNLCTDNDGNRFVLKTLQGSAYELYFAKELAVDSLIQNHDHLVRLADASFFIHRFEKSKNRYHLLYDYAEKGDLFDFLRKNFTPRRPPKPQWIAKTFLSIVRGLNELHLLGLIHRDIKLENIVIDRDDTIKICDFAFCEWDSLRRVGPANADFILKKERGHVLGTPGYIAPEIMIKQTASIKSDIFSLGVLLYEVTCAKSAFGNFSSANPSIREIVRPSELTFSRRCSPKLSGLILQMVAHKASQRPGLNEIATILEEIAES